MEFGSLHEQNFNVALASALRQTNPRWSDNPQRIQVERVDLVRDQNDRKIRPDILLCDEQLPPVILECSYAPSNAEKDAQARLGCKYRIHQVRTAVAIHVPTDFQRLQVDRCIDVLLEGRPVYSSIFQLLKDREQHASARPFDRRWPNSGFMEGTVHDLSLLVTGTALPKEDIEQVATKIAALVNRAANYLNDLKARQLESVASHVHQRSPLKALRTVMVLWLNALLTQQRLFLQSVDAADPVELPGGDLPRPSQVIAIWQRIHHTNWRSVFGPATEALKHVGRLHPHAASKALSALIQAVETIEVAQLGLHINIGAELFPKLSEDRKQAAAFYTQPSTAELLATLTILPEALPRNEWGQGRLFKLHRLADLACGTGTLLRAGYRRIASLHEKYGGTVDSLRTLHSNAMEHGLIGTDISPIAAHLTASSLAAIGQGEPYGDTNIGWVNVGGTGTGARAGSLEYFAGSNVEDLFAKTGGISTGDIDLDNRSVCVEDASLDWILMNPPYSRTRGGQSAFDVAGISTDERKACQKKWGDLVKHQAVNRKAGLAASFLALAKQKCKPGGRIGFVLPLTAAFADSWTITRQMVEQTFEDITAITVTAGKALGRDALSADTKMEEMLLIATKRFTPPPGSASKTIRCAIKCITLTSPVTRLGEAGAIAQAILSACSRAAGDALPIGIGSDQIGQLITLRKPIDGRPWSALGVVHAALAGFAYRLSTEGVFDFGDVIEELPVPLTTLEGLFTIGPTHHRIGHLRGNSPIGAFELCPLTSSSDSWGLDRALWAADSKSQTKLVIQPTHKGYAPSGVGSNSARAAMRRFQSTLFYSRNMRWTSQSLVSATCPRVVLGGRAWTALLHQNDTLRKALALWANSTLGMIMHWTQGQRTQAGRSTTQMAALRTIPCPNLEGLEQHQLAIAAAVFDELRTQVLLPACQAHADPVRRKIDSAVVKMLSLSSNAATAIPIVRWLWCNEPSVHAHNKAALRKIQEATRNELL